MVGAHYFLLAALVVSGAAAVSDWRTGRIPNWLTLGPLAVAPIAHTLAYGSVLGWNRAGEGLLFSLLGAAATSAVPLLLYFFGDMREARPDTAEDEDDGSDPPPRGMYPGDIKLLAAIGALCMVMAGVEIELYAFIIAALYAPARLAFEGKLFRVLGNTVLLAGNVFLPVGKKRQIAPEMLHMMRFGPSAFAGVCLFALLSWGTVG